MVRICAYRRARSLRRNASRIEVTGLRRPREGQANSRVTMQMTVAAKSQPMVSAANDTRCPQRPHREGHGHEEDDEGGHARPDPADRSVEEAARGPRREQGEAERDEAESEPVRHDAILSGGGP